MASSRVWDSRPRLHESKVILILETVDRKGVSGFRKVLNAGGYRSVVASIRQGINEGNEPVKILHQQQQ